MNTTRIVVVLALFFGCVSFTFPSPASDEKKLRSIVEQDLSEQLI